MPSPPVTIELYSDIHCPWAYMALFRLRKVLPEYDSRVRIIFRALSLELKNQRSTPKPILNVEIPLIAQQEPDIPIRLWSRPDWQFVPTLLPAFEAEKAAALQGDDAAWEFSWAVRHAFFRRSRTICMRYELAAIAADAGLDADRFLTDWDSGRMRQQVIADTNHGWEDLHVPGSPTFILPSRKQIPNPGAWNVTWSRDHLSAEAIDRDTCPNGDCLQPFRAMLDEALQHPGAT
jgi:predicted DsbA family dithiol-disulfide isomerase